VRTEWRESSGGEPWKDSPAQTATIAVSPQRQVRRPKGRRAERDGSCRPTCRTCTP
jgi:hypothetical protein